MLDNEFFSLEEAYLFNQGKLFHSYLKLGAHTVKVGNEWGVHFALWAPNAFHVSVVGDFNAWQGEKHGMNRLGESGIWQLFVPGMSTGNLYKFEIKAKDGSTILKADPFAFHAELRPRTASVVYSLGGYVWQDEAWLEERKTSWQGKPLLIYEVHLGSWRRKEDGRFLNYRELAREMVPYLADMGYTHVELMPLMEHPLDESWGYQVTGFYAPTSRYGTPHDLMYFIDQCHAHGIGVLLDWVPGHFCRDEHGLGRFDGKPLFEGEKHEEWGTYNFNFAQNEVRSFLISNALFWLDLFHVDGLRVDGVTSMLHFGRGRNHAAVNFLQELNSSVLQYHPHAIMAAEESSDWPKVTGSVKRGGLGFSHKWNMGWMNDTLNYIGTDFEMRREHHRLLTFSMVYAFSERFILPLSHDEVVHGKKSLIGRMPGDYAQKFAGLRALYLYQICHPGGKLMFMGGEFAQFIEWKVNAPLEWFLLDYEMHRKFHAYVRAANHLYRRERCLWEGDEGWIGFQWIDVHNWEQSVISFRRRALTPSGPEDNDELIILINFRPQAYEQFRIGVPCPGFYQVIFSTDGQEFGGEGGTPLSVEAENVPCHGLRYSITIALPPLAGLVIGRAGGSAGRKKRQRKKDNSLPGGQDELGG